eukprot:Skav204904  [mRNA]  locus=scaffold1926:287895:292482:+ [translate_table: standard]
MDSVQAADRREFRLTEQELLEFRCRGADGKTLALASKLSHSCRPNCHTVEDGKHLELRSLRDLAPKEALTISYIADEKLLLRDTESRRRYLWSQHCFRCCCARCCAEAVGATAPLGAAAVCWRRMEERVGNLLRPSELQLEGWRDLWQELMVWRAENVGVDHWTQVEHTKDPGRFPWIPATTSAARAGSLVVDDRSSGRVG